MKQIGGRRHVTRRQRTAFPAAVFHSGERNAKTQKKSAFNLRTTHLSWRLGCAQVLFRQNKASLLYLVLGVVGFISLLIGEFTGLISFGASGMLLFRFGLVCLGILVILLIVDLFTIPRQVRQANMAAENKIIDQLLNAPTGSNPV